MLLALYNVKTESFLKQFCVSERWNLQHWNTSHQRCIFVASTLYISTLIFIMLDNFKTTLWIWPNTKCWNSFKQKYLKILITLFSLVTSRWIHVDLMSILKWYVEKKISTNFYVIPTYFLRCNFDRQKVDVVSMYFYWRNFDRWNINIFLTYFFLK